MKFEWKVTQIKEVQRETLTAGEAPPKEDYIYLRIMQELITFEKIYDI